MTQKLNFSQRIGKSPITKTIQIDGMDSNLRNGLWNVVKLFFLDPIKKIKYGVDLGFDYFCISLYYHFYILPIDTIPNTKYEKEEFIRNSFFTMQWDKVYNFLEFIVESNVNNVQFDRAEFQQGCNNILERENSAYMFVDDSIAPITNSIEISEIEDAIDNSGQFTALKGANVHLKNSLEKLSEKLNPDYRNSIKESISAVESVAKTISSNSKDSLSAALDKIKGKTKIHSALEKGLKQIYGYTSDSNGIRHALMDNSECALEDAKFMLVSCSAFINYLIIKAQKAEIKFDN